MKLRYRIVMEEVQEAGDDGLFKADVTVAPQVESEKVLRRETLFTTSEVAQMKRVKAILKRIPSSARAGVPPQEILVVESANPDIPKGTILQGYSGVAAALGYKSTQAVAGYFAASRRKKFLHTKLRGVTLVKKSLVE